MGCFRQFHRVKCSYSSSLERNGKPVIITDEKTGKQVQKYAPSIINQWKDPNTGKMLYLKLTKGTPFVYTRDSAITNRKITKGDYLYIFGFTSPGGYASISQAGFIHVEYNKITKFTWNELLEMAKIAESE